MVKGELIILKNGNYVTFIVNKDRSSKQQSYY